MLCLFVCLFGLVFLIQLVTCQTCRNNSLKDFISVASPLGVTHLVMLSQTEKGPILRIGRIPRGPTLTFRVTAYSLAAAVRSSQRRPVDIASAFEHPPLVVLHNFTTAAGGVAAGASAVGAGVSLPDALKMCMVTFQNMFPPINPATVKLVDCRRVVLFHYHKGTGEIELRHYVIRAMPVGITRAVKKMAQARMPDLGGLRDVSEYVLSAGRAGAGAASDSEFEDDAGHVTLPQVHKSPLPPSCHAVLHNHSSSLTCVSFHALPQDFAGVGNTRSAQSAVRLSEIGPRMTLKLLKIEQDVCKGEVLYHGYVRRSAADAAKLRAAVKDRDQLKAQRRAVQDANVARKAAEKAAKKDAKAARIVEKQQAAVAAAADGTLGDAADEDEDDSDEDVVDEDGTDEDDEDAGIDDEEELDDDAEEDDDAPKVLPGLNTVAALPSIASGHKRHRTSGHSTTGSTSSLGDKRLASSTLAEPQAIRELPVASLVSSVPTGVAGPSSTSIVSPKTRGGKLLRLQQQRQQALTEAQPETNAIAQAPLNVGKRKRTGIQPAASLN